MAILKIKQLEERLAAGSQTVVATSATFATSAGNAGTSYRANRADFGSSGTAKLTGTGAWWSTSGIQG
jgi:hypothetical protein